MMDLLEGDGEFRWVIIVNEFHIYKLFNSETLNNLLRLKSKLFTMAVLTKHTLDRLCRDLDVDFKELTEEEFEKSIFKNTQVFYILNSKQNAFLYVYASILKDIKSFSTEYFENVPARSDDLIYVNENSGKYKYHLSTSCPFLTNDFEDFKIPRVIRDIGKDAIFEFRNWFAVNEFNERYSNKLISIEEILNEINNKYCSLYNINPIGIEEGIYQRIPNTGSGLIDGEFNFDLYLIKLNNIIKQIDEEFNGHDWRKFSKYDWLVNKTNSEIEEFINQRYSDIDLIERFGINKIKEKLATARKLKLELINSLKLYLRWHYNFSAIDFNEKSLDDFGLECCKNCEKQKKLAP